MSTKIKSLIIISIIMCLFSGCSNNSDNEITFYMNFYENANWYDRESLDLNSSQPQEIINDYTEECNKLLEEKGYDFHVVFKIQSPSNNLSDSYTKSFLEDMNLSSYHDESADIVKNQFKNVDMMIDLNEVMKDEMKKQLLDTLPEMVWNIESYKGQNFYIPANQYCLSQKGMFVPKEIAHLFTLNDKGYFNDFDNFVNIVKAGDQVTNQAYIPFFSGTHFSAFVHDVYDPVFAPLFDSTIYIKEENSDYKVVNLMDEKIYQDFYIIKAKLIEDGMTELSRSTLTEDGAKKEIMIAFDDCTSIKYPNRVFIPLEEKSYGSYNTNTGYGILKTSDNVEDSLTFLYLLNTDSDFCDLFTYGLKGKDYEIKDGLVYPLRDDLLMPNQYGGINAMVNTEKATQTSMISTDVTRALEEEVKAYAPRKIDGFKPTYTEESMELVDYIAGLEGSQVYSDGNNLEYIKELSQKLKDMGMDKEIERIQKELDEYMKE